MVSWGFESSIFRQSGNCKCEKVTVCRMVLR